MKPHRSTRAIRKAGERLAGVHSDDACGFAPRMMILNEIGIDVLGNNRNNIDAWIKRMMKRPSIRNLQGVVAVPVAGG